MVSVVPSHLSIHASKLVTEHFVHDECVVVVEEESSFVRPHVAEKGLLLSFDVGHSHAFGVL